MGTTAMLTEQCVACGADVPLSGAVHMLVNPKDGGEVTDGYLCRNCYEEHVEPILPGEDDAAGEDDPRDDAAGEDDPRDDAAGEDDLAGDDDGDGPLDDEADEPDVGGDDARPGEA
jgi:hypothetical protein